MRSNKQAYCFIFDENKKFYQATQSLDGGWTVFKNSDFKPTKSNPKNMYKSEHEFATNNTYNSLTRSVSDPYEFVNDAAAILRHVYHLGKGISEKTYLTIIEWNDNNGVNGLWKLAYSGRFSFEEKRENPKTGSFTCPIVDSTLWGIISEKQDVMYSIDCNAGNTDAIRVLVDGITLENRYTYQPTPYAVSTFDSSTVRTIPFLMINQDGDDFGIIHRNQLFALFSDLTALQNNDLQTFGFITSHYQLNGVKITGSFTFTTDAPPSSDSKIMFYTSTGQQFLLYSIPGNSYPPIPNYTYIVNINITLNLAPNETVFFVQQSSDSLGIPFSIFPTVTNITVKLDTRTNPQVVYCLRVLDLFKQIVSLMTDNKYTINSNYFTADNKSVVTSGDAIRNVPNAKIFTCFKDGFISFDSIFYIAMRLVNDDVFIELHDDVYGNQSTNLIDLGEALNVELSPASDKFCNQVTIGSPKQDYRHFSGKLEFNSEATFSLDLNNVTKKMELISKYRYGCYDVQFVILDHQLSSTKDATGDNSVFILDITDDTGSAVQNIDTFNTVTINNAPLQPIIKSPLDNDTITYDKPIIRGVCQPSTNVNIYVDGSLDGPATSDTDGNWNYSIQTSLSSYVSGSSDGVHEIKATFTDLIAPVSSITIVVNTGITTSPTIEYPDNAIFNNKPLIKGRAQRSTNIDVFIDGVFIGATVADASCKWEFQSGVLSNLVHQVSINGLPPFSFEIDANVQFPLITYIDNYLDGFVITNNLPLIRGVAQPNTNVDIWLNYIEEQRLGQVMSDANGNWEFQVVPVSYVDISTGVTIDLAPIRNGVSIISTSLENQLVAISINGFTLNRPAFSSITGVPDNTVFNTRYSPWRCMMRRKSQLSSIMNKQRSGIVKYEHSDKNGLLRTVLGTEVIAENQSIPVSSLGTPNSLLEYATIKVNAKNSFAETLRNFNNGGTIVVRFKGSIIYLIPKGEMKIPSLISEVQEWKLEISPLTSYLTLLNLYKNGLTINLMENAIYHSDYNSLHFVEYNFQLSDKYSWKSIYEDRFENRNDSWALNPDYIQKISTNEVIIDQVITNGISSMTLRTYRCYDAELISVINYNPVSPSPLTPPEIVLEAEIDYSLFAPEEDYFHVMFVNDTPVSISEKISLKTKWDGTILIESRNSKNKVGAFFSTGFKTVIRVEGMLKKPQALITTEVSNNIGESSELLYSAISRRGYVRYGTAYGLPDYLALKIAEATILDELTIERGEYTIDPDEKMAPSEDIDGHPLYFYNVALLEKDNSHGKVFQGVGSSITGGATINIDGTTFGMPTGTVITASLE